MNESSHRSTRTWQPCLSWLALLLVTPASLALAQPAAPEFEGMFGQKGFYAQCKPGQDQNGICTLPPNSNPPEGFISPTGVDWLSKNRLVIADRGNNKLQVCDDQADCYWIGGDGQGSGQFSGRNFAGTFDLPHGVEVNRQGRIAVADEDNQLYQYCTDSGDCLALGPTTNNNAGCQSGLGKWCEPHDAAFSSSGLMYVLDSGNNRIQVVQTTLNTNDVQVLAPVRQLGKTGTAPGELNLPGGIAIDAQDRILIADTGNHRIQRCTEDPPNLVCETFGSLGSTVGQFDTPTGIDVDGFGRIWIADTNNHRVQVCDPDFQCTAFGSFGDFDPFSDTAQGDASEGPGLFNLPHDVAVHPSGRVAVVDTANHRIQLFRTEAACGTDINPGMNDAWFDPDNPGQGFLISVFPDLQTLFLAHFTYDAERPAESVTATIGEPGHRWLTAAGAFCGRTADLDVALTFGGAFDTGDPSPDTETGYGSYRLRFPDCASAILDYELPVPGLDGRIELERIVNDNIVLCEALGTPAD